MPDMLTMAPPDTWLRLQLYYQGRLASEWRFAEAFRIGRDAACDVRLDDPRVQDRHAEIYRDGGGWFVRDMGGKIDTFVNGAQVDTIRLGSPSTVQIGWNGPLLRVTIEQTTPDADADADVANARVNGAWTPTPEPERRAFAAPARPKPEPPAPEPPDAALPADTPRYRGHGFSLPLPKAWQDRTLYTLAGPTADGIRHSVLVEVHPNADVPSLDAYVDEQARLLGLELDGFRLLKRDEQALVDGTPAARLIFRWKPYGRPPIYQEQLFVRRDTTVYKLTATFSHRSRKQLGPQVETLMLHFSPE